MQLNQIMIIPEIYKPLESLIIWDGAFSDRDIEEIISVGELLEFERGSNKGVIAVNEGVLNYDIRDTDITWIEPRENTEWLYRRMTEMCAKINDDKFQFDLTHFHPFQYGKYKKDGHYDWHTDSGPTLNEHRKLSFVLGLTDPDDYEGGELEINVNGHPDSAEIFKIKKGHLIVFPSYIPHKVRTVTAGERLTLVGWAVGPKFK